MKAVKNNELCPRVTLQDIFSVNKFHEPFKYPEWRRELIYSISPRTKKKYCQPYYYYNNIKLGTNKQIAEKLKEFDETLKTNGRSVSGLTLKNFSLKHSPIGINDSNKELIKDLTQKVSKNLETSEKHGKPSLPESSNLSSFSGEKPSTTTMETNSDTIQVDEPETSILNSVSQEHLSIPNSKKRKGEENLSSNKKIKIIDDISDPKYKEPFKYPEFQREVVFRNKKKSKSSNKASIYYYLRFTSDDKTTGYKLKSITAIPEKLKEFENYLQCKDRPPSGLTADNFTFIKKPLGLDDSKKELIRNAKLPVIKKKLKNVRNKNPVKEHTIKYSSPPAKTSILSTSISSENGNDPPVTENVEESTNIRLSTSETIENENENDSRVNENVEELASSSLSTLQNTISDVSENNCTENMPLEEDIIEIIETERQSPLLNKGSEKFTKKSFSRKTKSYASQISGPENELTPSEDAIQIIEQKKESSLTKKHCEELQQKLTTILRKAIISNVSETVSKDNVSVAEDVIEIEQENESDTLKKISDLDEKERYLIQELTKLQKSRYLEIEKNFKIKEAEYKKLLGEKNRMENLYKADIKELELKIYEEKTTRNQLKEKIKNLETEAEYKNLQNEKLNNDIKNLTNLHKTETTNLQKEIDNYKIKSQSEAQKCASLEAELKEAKSSKDNLIKYIDNIKDKFN